STPRANRSERVGGVGVRVRLVVGPRVGRGGRVRVGRAHRRALGGSLAAVGPRAGPGVGLGLRLGGLCARRGGRRGGRRPGGGACRGGGAGGPRGGRRRGGRGSGRGSLCARGHLAVLERHVALSGGDLLLGAIAVAGAAERQVELLRLLRLAHLLVTARLVP